MNSRPTTLNALCKKAVLPLHVYNTNYDHEEEPEPFTINHRQVDIYGKILYVGFWPDGSHMLVESDAYRKIWKPCTKRRINEINSPSYLNLEFSN